MKDFGWGYITGAKELKENATASWLFFLLIKFMSSQLRMINNASKESMILLSIIILSWRIFIYTIHFSTYVEQVKSIAYSSDWVPI